MSENLNLARTIYAAWETGDYSSVDWADPDIEYVVVDGPTPGTWHGHAGMADAWRSFLDAWEGFRAGESELHEVDANRVLVLSDTSGRGRTSGVELGQMGMKGAALLEFREGKVTRLAVYMDSRRALADAGLKD